MFTHSTFSTISEFEERLAFLKKHSKYSGYSDIPVAQNSLFSKSLLSLINATPDCSQCFYGLQIDSYVNGCSHDCSYCWAKAELTKFDKWNNPAPTPIDLSALWEIFYTVFETDRKTPFRNILLKKTPLRIGSLSDPFLSFEKKQFITYELLKILNHYEYPCVILTRSSMIASEKYLKILNPDKVSVQLSIPSNNEKLVRILEPGADDIQKRLSALKTLNENKIWTSVRINPLFPIYPDGFLQNSNNKLTLSKNNFDYFNFSLLDQIAEHKCKSLLVGFVHMDEKTTSVVGNKTKFDLRSLMKDEIKKSTPGFKYSNEEIRAYYELIADKCRQLEIQFSTCYLGLGESFFWKDQDLWADKNDCCNIKKNVSGFKSDTREISLTQRYKIMNPDSGILSTITFPSWLYKIKSFLLKNLWS